MNNNSKELVKQFVYQVLDDDCGVSKEAYDMLNLIMVTEREMASVLHDVVAMAVESEGRYVINPKEK